ncbi:MAG: hypothetical protein ACLUOI_21495 [Eisenbergiella sp.]
MLRHYDEIGIPAPNVDDFTGYRHYSEAQLPGRENTGIKKPDSLSVIKEILGKHEDAEKMEKFLLVKRKELEEEASKRVRDCCFWTAH